MKISDYGEKDGEITFLVDSELFTKIVERLRSEKISVGGHLSDTSFSEVSVGADIGAVNEALKDFDA